MSRENKKKILKKVKEIIPKKKRKRKRMWIMTKEYKIKAYTLQFPLFKIPQNSPKVQKPREPFKPHKFLIFLNKLN